ncbi:MAG: hypothetical protein AAGG55_02835 [Pseudomonadota bacterium]
MNAPQELPPIEKRFGEYHLEVGCYIENMLWVVEAVLEHPNDQSTPWFLIRKLLQELDQYSEAQITVADTSKLQLETE